MQLSGSNFQSWTTFSLDIEGLTCIVGPSNLGKSAIFRSLVAITRNDLPEGWIREGTKKVELTLTDGPVGITMYRSDKTSPVYTIGDNEYSKLNGKVPDEVAALGLAPIKVGTFTFDPSFASQFDPQFGLTWSPTELNSVLGAFSSTEKLEKGKKEVNRRITQTNQEAQVVAEEVASIKGQLIRCKELAQVAQEVQQEIQARQEAQKVLVNKSGLLLDTSAKRAEWNQIHTVVRDFPEVKLDSMRVTLSVGLIKVSVLSEFIPLVKSLSEIQTTLEAIPDLSSPDFSKTGILTLVPVLLQPRMAPEDLERIDLSPLEDLMEKCKALHKVLALTPGPSLGEISLPEPPSLDKLECIERLIYLRKDCGEAGKAIEELEGELEEINQELAPLKKELQALDEIECPACHHRWKETK